MGKHLLHVILSLLFLVSYARADEQRVEVGLLASLSGNWAAIGRNIQQGAALAVEEANATGGVLGVPVTLNVQDTDEEKSGAKVVSAYRFLQQQGVRFFIGPTGVPGIVALTPLGIKDDMVLIAPTSTNSFYKSSEKFFNASGDNFNTTQAIAERAYARGFRRVAIFSSLQPWENDQATTFRERFRSLGGEIIAEQYPAADQGDLRNEALRIVRSKPDAVFLAIFNQVAIAAKALRAHGYVGATFASIMDDSHVAASDGALNGAELYLFNPPGPAFVGTFTERYRVAPGVFADSAYDATASLLAAINRAGSLERSRVIAALHELRFTGSSGEQVGYDRHGLLARKISLHRIVSGRIERIDAGEESGTRPTAAR